MSQLPVPPSPYPLPPRPPASRPQLRKLCPKRLRSRHESGGRWLLPTRGTEACGLIGGQVAAVRWQECERQPWWPVEPPARWRPRQWADRSAADRSFLLFFFLGLGPNRLIFFFWRRNECIAYFGDHVQYLNCRNAQIPVLVIGTDAGAEYSQS